MRESLDAWRATGAGLGLPSYLGRLAEGYLRGGQLADARAMLAEALTSMDRNGQRYYEPELQRLRGEIVLASARRDSRTAWREAADAFTTARTIAAHQQSAWLDLRAATSLARLQHRQGLIAEARRTLEGAGGPLIDDPTADAAAARALHRELRRDGKPSSRNRRP
jgi:predicted ATPase